jgi:hypothetical protein
MAKWPGTHESLLAYVVLYISREPVASKLSIHGRVTSRQFSREIVMRNFIYSLTLGALGFMQIAIVVVELTHA